MSAGPMVSSAHAQSAAVKPAAADAWWWSGFLEAGGRTFLNNPNRNGTIGSGQQSLAKYYEYSTIAPGAFLDAYLAAGSKNGLYKVDFGAKNVGYSDQSYFANLSKAGEHYLTFGWDETPHLYSTSAQTIYNGVGSNALTVPAGIGTRIFTAINGVAPTNNQWPCLTNSGTATNPCNTTNNPGRTLLSAGQAAAIQSVLNANMHRTDIGIRRDTASVEYRWTPTDAWDVKADYTHMHRTGTQVEGIAFSPGTSGAKVEAPRPVDDTTQNFGLNGEYAGSSPWGQKATFKLAYNGSIYKDGYDSYSVENPFCDAANATGGYGVCARTGSPSYPLAQMSMWPSNNANAFTATIGADLPNKSRYMGTLSYTMMRQNQAFLPYSPNSTYFTSNTAPGPLTTALTSGLSLPASSLNGAINTLLSNNVLTTQITPELKSKLSYRYYNYDNDTPELTFPNWVVTDSQQAVPTTSATYAPVRSISMSYIRQNAGAELNWHPNRQWNVGVAYGFERYDRTREDVNRTNENSGKIYADWKPTSWITGRASWLYAVRRYDNYDYLGYVGKYQWPNGTFGNTWYTTAYRQFFLDNRDRNKGQLSLGVDLIRGFTVTPIFGWRNDDFGLNPPADAGLQHSHSWNTGVEVAHVVNPDTRLLFSYMYEHQSQLVASCSTISGSNPACNVATNSDYRDNVEDKINTFIVAMDHALIPNKLDMRLGYTLSHAVHDQPLIFTNTGAGPTAATGGQYPRQTFLFQRFEALAKYKFDQTQIRALGWKGEVSAKLRYVWERNSVNNFQTDVMQPYMYSYIPSTAYMTWMAFDNPNYNVHLLGGSIVWNW